MLLISVSGYRLDMAVKKNLNTSNVINKPAMVMQIEDSTKFKYIKCY